MTAATQTPRADKWAHRVDSCSYIVMGFFVGRAFFRNIWADLLAGYVAGFAFLFLGLCVVGLVFSKEIAAAPLGTRGRG